MRMTWRLIVPLVTAAILPLGVGAQAPGAGAQAGAKTADVRNGRQRYLDYKCYACHGYSGQNGPGTRLVPARMNLPGFMAYVRNPRQMPPYAATAVPDRDLADIWAYLQTLPKSPAAKDIALLNQILNEK